MQADEPNEPRAGAGTATAPRCETSGGAPGRGWGLRSGGRGFPGVARELLTAGGGWGAPGIHWRSGSRCGCWRGPCKATGGLSGVGGPRCPRFPLDQPRGSPRGFTSTYRRFSSGRPRKAPGWTVLIRLFFRSLWTDTDLVVCKSLVSSFTSLFPLVISAKGAGKAQSFPMLMGGTPAPLHHGALCTMEHHALCTPRGCYPPTLLPRQLCPNGLSPARGIRAHPKCQHGPRRVLCPVGSSFGLLT